MIYLSYFTLSKWTDNEWVYEGYYNRLYSLHICKWSNISITCMILTFIFTAWLLALQALKVKSANTKTMKQC